MKSSSTEDTKPESQPSIRTTQRSGLSIDTRLIKAFIKPLKRLLSKPPSDHSKNFSEEISFPTPIQKALGIEERTVHNIRIYDLSSKKAKTTSQNEHSKRILYFAGGSWQMPPQSAHFGFLKRLVKDLPSNTVISVVSHPLALNFPAPKAFPALLDLYNDVMAHALEHNESVIIAGDSSGGNIALCLVLEALRQQPDCPAPEALVLISPTMDLTYSNSAIEAVARVDPVLILEYSKKFGKEWSGDWDPATDARISPIRATNLVTLRDRGIHVHCVFGTHDILSPDALLFRDKLIENGVQGEWLVWEGMFHCWILMAGFATFNSELKEGWEWVLDRLKNPKMESISSKA
ncbi:alpha/beta-hydrolase [Microthyrium microscopicum]|uniref:Alpha/beta-hydrolase n=1 Tax=Microthyrium microscopicum TaxID=703497 RepID=A0A6A6UN40_9PEZI|nr:alpha/beta-hydrolase [Microthyrium microscopicum]